ncbi:MAG: plasmid pRiA4b ORF-3 family protein [Armatimonadetes bacterium]|nr:plasmid pRiA4b ORF-3 family protein [Armatimonadota bacterium]
MARLASSIYQLKVTLRWVKPPIWRRIRVPGNMRLSDLHDVLQAVMGWHDYHLHVFEVDGFELTTPGEPGDLVKMEMEDARRMRLNRFAPSEKSRFRYEYDFGDGWVHDIVVEKILPPDPSAMLPWCVTGRRRCPPEDCGGAYGYMEMLATLADPTNPSRVEVLEWIGGDWDPEAFDIGRVNAALERLRGAKRG